MSLSDTIYCSKEIIIELDLLHPTTHTIDLNLKFRANFVNCLKDFYLDYTKERQIKLFELEEPNKNFWHEYTTEELENYNKNIKPDSILYLHPGDGFMPDEAFLPKNRKKIPMKDGFPHQWLKMSFVDWSNIQQKVLGRLDVNLKFTDGVVVYHEFIKENDYVSSHI